MGPRALNVNNAGRVAVFVLGVMGIGFALSFTSFPMPKLWGLGIMIVLECLYYLAKRRLRAARKAKAEALQRELHDLKQQEFALRFEEARQNGSLDRYTK